MPILRHQVAPETELWLRERLKTFGRRLQYWRRKRRWSVLDLSRQAGVSVATIRAVERGAEGTTLVTLLLVANALDVALPYLCENYLPALDFTLT